jgi:hypothetical protein
MDDLIVFFGEAFSKVLGQDGGSRTEVVLMAAPLLGRNGGHA